MKHSQRNNPFETPASTNASTFGDVISSAARTSAERARGLLADGSDFFGFDLHPKQAEFVDDDRPEALYGGAAGGGKSVAMLASALKYAHVPNYSAVLVRRAYSHLTAPGGLVPMSREVLAGKADWNQQSMQWTFPNGAVLSFGYLDHDRHLDKFQGAEYQFIGVDEATQIREEHYRYLFSRLRKRLDIDVPLRMRAASNPGGISQDFFKRRFLIEENSDRIYIPARIADNPSLDQEAYTQSLLHLDPLTRERLMNGDWDAVPDGGMFRRHWFEVIEQWQVPPDLRCVRFWDRASTIPRSGADPDWTVGALVGCKRGVWFVTDLQRFRGGSAENERRIRATAKRDGRGVRIYMEQEPGSSGKDVIDHYARNILRGFTFKSQRPTGKKHERAAPVASAAEMGHVKLVSGRWVSDFLDEAASFPMGAHDDQIDAISGAFGVLTKKYVTRSFVWDG